MNAQKLIELMFFIILVVAAFVHGSLPMSEGVRLAIHGWWFIWKIGLVILAGGSLLIRRMRLRPAASEACRENERTPGR